MYIFSTYHFVINKSMLLKSVFIPFLIIYFNFFNTVNSNDISITINVQNVRGKVKHFWKSTGFSPLGNMTTVEKFILSNDEKINLALIGALPNNGISHVRIHWLINLIRINSVNQGDYKYLDELIFWLRKQHLYPGFELMGTPINANEKQYFNKSYAFWNNITAAILNRYGQFYKAYNIYKWKFETWNEPDLLGYNILNFTLLEYIDYVHATSNALHSYNRRYNANLILGGPAGLFKQEAKHPLCWGLMKYCNDFIKSQRNKSNCPIDYITFHKKGNGSSNIILQEDLELLDMFQKKFPGLRKLPIANDEADILVNWSKDEEWRGDVRYAAMIANVIINHYKEIIVKRKYKIEVLSNDNAFLNYHPYYFTQRTLFARFQMNNTRPPHVQFVQKPSYAIMGLLSLLGDRYLPSDEVPEAATRAAAAATSTVGVPINSSSSASSIASSRSLQATRNMSTHADLLTVLATRSGNGISDSSDGHCHVATIVTFANDTIEDSHIKSNIYLKYTNLPIGDCFYVIYLLDNEKTNPYKEWQSVGSPVFPSPVMRAKMRSVQEPFRMHPPTQFSTSNITINLPVTLPTVAMINICCRGAFDLPGPVTDLQVLKITKSEVLLLWKDNKVNSKCLRTYEVEFQSSCGNLLMPTQFQLVHRPDSIYLSYQHHYVTSACFSTRARHPQSLRNISNTDGPDAVTSQEKDCDKKLQGCRRTKTYRVRAVDYWNRTGPYSDIVEI